MLNNFALSLIRTYVPIAVGAALTWLVVQLGVVIDEASASGVVATAVLVISGTYYLLARWLESRWPWLSVLLGTPPSVSTPTYTQLPKE